jgi:UDP-glucose:(heptosyl)LPS alpha-1,3-glucosyltransferase
MKIAFAIEHFDPRQGGAEQYTWNLAKWLAARGHTITIFSTRASPADFPAEIIPLKAPTGSHAYGPLRMAAGLRAALSGRSFDVVHGANHFWPCDVLRPGGGVHVAFERYNAESDSSAMRRTFRKFLNRWGRRSRALRENERHQFGGDPLRQFIAVSRRVADDMVRCYPSCAGRVHVIYNGGDPGRFSPETVAPLRTAAREAAGVRGGEPVLLFVSNNFRLKGLCDLIRSLPLLKACGVPDFRLLIAGRGNPEPYRRLAAAGGVADRVCFLGPCESMLDAYAAADALVHPTYYDAFGFAGLEAMACGLPVVISRNAGVSELMAGIPGAMEIAMPCAPRDLAAAMAAAVSPEFRAAARVSNRAVALRHRNEENFARVLALYEDVARRRRARGGPPEPA